MKRIEFSKLPNKVKETDIYDNCNEFHVDQHQVALYDKEFEEYFKCRLIMTQIDSWICEFEDIDFTWFLLRWS